MSASDRIKLRGRAAELRENLQEFETRAQNHIITIRNLIDPYEDLPDLEVERAEQAMISLKVLVTKAREAKKTLAKIDKDLNG